MTTLLIDIGNARMKWARLDGTRLGRAHASAYAGWSGARLGRRLWGRSGHGVEQAVVTSVADVRVKRALASAAHGAGIRVRFVKVRRRAGGVTVGYLEPWRLGADRFAAAVGAHHLFADIPVCIADVGTAMTLDLVDSRGRHRGGAIIPAPALMMRTLLGGTHGIRRRAQGGAPGAGGLFGRSTRAGVVEGARHAAAALIDRAVGEAQVLVRRRPLVVLTGGQASAVRALLHSPYVTVPDLVLRGLAVLARGQDAPFSRRPG